MINQPEIKRYERCYCLTYLSDLSIFLRQTMSKNKIIYISVAAAIILIAALIYLNKNNVRDEIPTERKGVDKKLLVGAWVRTDANYLIKINEMNNDGTLDAQYFNPRPINVGNAIWEESDRTLKIIIELRDVNYPGSTYTLYYLSDRDMLAGEYYQAVEGLTFYVEFARNK
jgi:hypothetical protein